MDRKSLRLQDLIRVVEDRSSASQSLLATAVGVAGELEELRDELVDHYVRAAREEGCSWFQIGHELGVTRQAAHKRFGHGRMRTLGVGRRSRRRCETTLEDGTKLFAEFTDRAKDALSLAQIEARELGHNYLGTEHLLLGLIIEKEGIAARVLNAQGVSDALVRDRIEAIVGRGPQGSGGPIPFTPRSKKVLEMAHSEARKAKSDTVDTEHVLLAIIAEGGGLATKILTDAGVQLIQLRGAASHATVDRTDG